jgi:chromate transporter
MPHDMKTSHASISELARAFLKLGCISFGGPIAHLGYLRNEFVARRKWVSDGDYAELVALCQFLPGPASSQVVFGLGMKQRGILGGVVASFFFTMPSAILMIAFAYGVSAVGDLSKAGWVHGLKIAAVAVVAQAVLGMWRSLCFNVFGTVMCIAAAAALVLLPGLGGVTQVGVIAAGAIIGWILFLKRMATKPQITQIAQMKETRGRLWFAGGILILWAVLLAVLPVMAKTTGDPHVRMFDSFYRAGSLVFGGGHVVLPLLRAEVVPVWIADDKFLAGYGAAQAVPGPLFTFSAYLGAAMEPGKYSWVNGIMCLAAIFLPAWLLIAGALPFWHWIGGKPWARAAMRGANAAVVGVLLAALWDPVIKEGIKHPKDALPAIIAFIALMLKVPAWVIVPLAAAFGFATQ